MTEKSISYRFHYISFYHNYVGKNVQDNSGILSFNSLEG